jgi:hypothetical protein
MLNVVLNRTDCIETLLPAVESAMSAGEVCRVHNINFLGPLEVAALTLLVMADNLLDMNTGKICRAQPGFRLLGIDERGLTRTLAM